MYKIQMGANEEMNHDFATIHDCPNKWAICPVKSLQNSTFVTYGPYHRTRFFKYVQDFKDYWIKSNLLNSHKANIENNAVEWTTPLKEAASSPWNFLPWSFATVTLMSL